MTSRGLEILDTDACLELLRARTFGRVSVQIGDAPAILPVNYALLDDEVVFRTDPGTKLSAALMRTMVAFEVDDTDPVTRSGWSVLVVGFAEEIRDRATRARIDALGLEPWVTEGIDFVVRIRTRTISGRRLAGR